MKKRNRRHRPEQIVTKLRDAEVMLDSGKSMEEFVIVMEVSEATFNRWRKQYGGMKKYEHTLQSEPSMGSKCNFASHIAFLLATQVGHPRI